jgi:hypothetical protein
MSTRGERRPRGIRPSQVRLAIANEHEELRRVLRDVDALAVLVMDGNRGAYEMLRLRAGQLYYALCKHTDLEDEILAPALRETPGFGEIREAQLLEHHREQRDELHSALAELSSEDEDPAELATRIRDLLARIRIDMAHEDRDLLNDKLLKDDLIDVSFIG